MSTREAFELAYTKSVMAVSKMELTSDLADLLKVMSDHRIDEESYLFNFPTHAPLDNLLTTGMVNAAWWAWREAQHQLLATMGSADHVVH
jgi:hypothetical protein